MSIEHWATVKGLSGWLEELFQLEKLRRSSRSTISKAVQIIRVFLLQELKQNKNAAIVS